MTSEQLKLRTKQFSLSIIGYQIAKSGTSVGANYRAVCRARSDKEFIAKMEIVLEESDETLFWLEIILEKKWLEESLIQSLWREGNELTSIFVSSLKTAKAKTKL